MSKAINYRTLGMALRVIADACFEADRQQRNGEMNTQRIVDVLNTHWQADLQQRYNDARLELSQQRQNAELIAALKTTTTTTT